MGVVGTFYGKEKLYNENLRNPSPKMIQRLVGGGLFYQIWKQKEFDGSCLV